MAASTAAALAACLAVPGLQGAESTGDRRQILKEEITAELRLSVTRGLKHLVERQGPTGDFDPTFPVAVNSLVGLAFLAGGYTERIGPPEYTTALRRGTEALLSRQNDRGYFDDGKSHMYGHGFATLYLAELYGTFGSEEKTIRDALKSAIAVIVGSQGPQGGWDYDPAPAFARTAKQVGGSDTSITVCQTMALRAARNLGLSVSEAAVARARAYIARAQNADGGFRYRQVEGGYFRDSSAFPRSAAGVCILYSLGNYSSEAIRKGFDYLHDNYRFPWSNMFPYYAHYYCAQAMFQAGGRYWKDYFPWITRSLLDEQAADGGWRASMQENSAQATAMALIILQLPYRFLPIHER